MIELFFILFVTFTILYCINIKHKTVIDIMLAVCGICLILVAGLREKGFDKDYYIYKAFWMTTNLKDNVEYSFYLIRNFIKYELRLKFQYVLLIYAFLGVTIKLISFRKISPFIWASLLIYFSHYFMLHEFTQIRIGVATGFMLLSLYYLADRKYILFFVFASVAIFFHQSCFFIVIFPLLNNSEKKIQFYYWLIPAGYLLYFFNTYLNISIPIPGIQDKIDGYEEATRSGFLKDETTNVFNALFLLRITVFYTLLYFAKKIAPHLNSFYLLIKIYSLSLFSFLFLAKIPVFAFRIQELLGVVEIILIPCLIFLFAEKFRFLGIILVWLIAVVMFCMDIYYVKLIIVK